MIQNNQILNNDDKLDFINHLLITVGVNIIPCHSKDKRILEIKKERDIRSLYDIDSILKEYHSYLSINSEIKEHLKAAHVIMTSQIDSSVKDSLIATCNKIIEDLKQKQQFLHYFQEFECVEKMKKNPQCGQE